MVNIVRVAEKGGGHTHRSVADVGNFDIYHLGYLLSHILPRLSVRIKVWGFYEKQWAYLTLRAWHSVHTMRARRRNGMTVDELEDVGRLALAQAVKCWKGISPLMHGCTRQSADGNR